MAIESAPYYWVVCDQPGCGAKSPGPDDESSAWDDATWALDYARDSDWTIRYDGPEYLVASTHLCPEHAAHWLCADCGDDLPEPVADPEQRLCTACIEGDGVSEPTSRPPEAGPLALVVDVLEWIDREWAGTTLGPAAATLGRMAALIRVPGMYEHGTLCPLCLTASCRDSCPLRPYRTPHHHGDCPAGCAMPPSRHLVHPGLLMERA